MGYVRNLGDGPDFYKWQREVTYSDNDAKVVLITNMENHMTDWELYLAGKNMQGQRGYKKQIVEIVVTIK